MDDSHWAEDVHFEHLLDLVGVGVCCWHGITWQVSRACMIQHSKYIHIPLYDSLFVSCLSERRWGVLGDKRIVDENIQFASSDLLNCFLEAGYTLVACYVCAGDVDVFAEQMVCVLMGKQSCDDLDV